MAGPLILSNRLQKFHDSMGRFGDTMSAIEQRKQEEARQSVADAQAKQVHDQTIESGKLTIGEQQRKARMADQLQGMQSEFLGLMDGQGPQPAEAYGNSVMPDSGQSYRDRLMAKMETASTGKPVTMDEIATRRKVEGLGVQSAEQGLTLTGNQDKRAGERHASDLKTAEESRRLIRANAVKANAAANGGDGPVKLNAEQAKTIAAAGMAKSMLDDIAQKFKVGGLGGGAGYAADIVESVPFFGGKMAPKTAEYNDQRRIVAETFLREATGAAAPAAEVKFYQNLLPEPGDNPEQAQSALNAFRGAVQSKVKGVAETLRAQGKEDDALLIEGSLDRLFANSEDIVKKPGSTANKEDQDAIDWARANPNDKRSADILRMNGAR